MTETSAIQHLRDPWMWPVCYPKLTSSPTAFSRSSLEICLLGVASVTLSFKQCLPFWWPLGLSVVNGLMELLWIFSQFSQKFLGVVTCSPRNTASLMVGWLTRWEGKSLRTPAPPSVDLAAKPLVSFSPQAKKDLSCHWNSFVTFPFLICC